MAEQKCDKKCENKPPDPTPDWAVFLTIVFIAVVCLVISAFPLLYGGGNPNVGYEFPQNAHNFGDSMGFANVVVSFAAFAALVWSLHMQRDELKQQRWELEQMRKANETSAKAQMDSHEALERATRYAALETIRHSAEEMAREGTGALRTQVLTAMMIRNVIENTLSDTLKNDKYLKLNIGHSDKAVRMIVKTIRTMFHYKEESEFSELYQDVNGFAGKRQELLEVIHVLLQRSRYALKRDRLIGTDQDRTMMVEEHNYRKAVRILSNNPKDSSVYDEIDIDESIAKLSNIAELVIKKSRLSKALGEQHPFPWESAKYEKQPT